MFLYILLILWQKIFYYKAFLIARPARSDPRNSFVVRKKQQHFLNFFEYFVMFWFQVLTCLEIVSYWIFRQVWICSNMFENHMNYNNSYHIHRIWTSLDMFQHVQTCLRITWIVTIHIILNLNKFRHVWESYEF